MDALPAGTRLHGGAFTIECTLAASNFSFTYLAREAFLRRDVALKEFFPLGCRRAEDALGVLPPSLPGSVFENAREKFLEEARALAVFHHSGIVDVHSFFEENNTAYMSMEFLVGQTLGQQLAAQHTFEETEVLEIGQSVAQTLEVVHSGGLLHCDLTPDNIFRCDDGRMVLLDFGLSTRLNVSNYSTCNLNDSLRFGTPGYAPLEQYAASGVLCAATDVYALSATLYHLLTGQMPATATDRAYGLALPTPRELNPRLSSHTSAAILWALQMSPASRPASAREFAAHLRQRSDFEQARAHLMGVLQARIAQLQTRSFPSSQTRDLKSTPSSANNQRSSEPDDSGCLQFGFLAYLIFWLFAAVICMAWLFVQFIQVRW